MGSVLLPNTPPGVRLGLHGDTPSNHQLDAPPDPALVVPAGVTLPPPETDTSDLSGAPAVAA